jgi:hypothetical protein
MFAPRNLFQSMSGSKINGDAARDNTRKPGRSSTSIASGWEQWWHSESTRTRSLSPLRHPCTKDVAKASSAQAPKIFSPVENVRRCGVREVVTGNAQLTFPSGSRTRKNKFLSSSVRTAETVWRLSPVVRAIPIGGIGLFCLGSSRTTKSRTI